MELIVTVEGQWRSKSAVLLIRAGCCILRTSTSIDPLQVATIYLLCGLRDKRLTSSYGPLTVRLG